MRSVVLSDVNAYPYSGTGYANRHTVGNGLSTSLGSSFLATALLCCFLRRCLARSRCLLSGEVFELGAGLQLLPKPYGLSSSSCPGVAGPVAVLDGDLPSLQ